MKATKVVITGGSGLVGRSLKDLVTHGVYLSSGDYDLTSEKEVAIMYKDLQPDIIVHLAAKVGGIVDNINKPAEYFDDNVIINTNVVRFAYKFGVSRFIGVLSTCIYPDTADIYPMTEEMLHLGPPTKTNFSYGYAKRCLAVQIDAYNQQYGTKYQYLIPSNLYGEYDKWGENSHFVAALIKKIIIADRRGDSSIELFGTGTPLRQFLHSSDLARVIRDCIENDITESFNVTTSENLSIKKIAEIAIDTIKPKHVKYVTFNTQKPDGQFRKDVSNSKMLQLLPNFQFTPLREGIGLTYNAIKTYNFENI